LADLLEHILFFEPPCVAAHPIRIFSWLDSQKFILECGMPSSYDKAKHIVEVDEKILAVFIVDSAGKISDLFIAEDTNIERSFI
jgi:hypothetical protein